MQKKALETICKIVVVNCQCWQRKKFPFYWQNLKEEILTSLAGLQYLTLVL